MRNEETIAQGKILNLQKNRIEVSEVKTGEECGLLVSCSKTIEQGDQLVFFRKI